MIGTIRDAAPLCGRPWSQAAKRRGLSLPRQFLRYVACAGVAAAVNFVAGSILVEGFGFTSALCFPLAVAIAYGLGMAVNFLGNRRFTFTSDRTGIDQARTFIVVALCGLALTTVIAALGREILASLVIAGGFPLTFMGPLSSPETLSRAVAIAIASIYSFAGHKYLTFNRGVRLPLLRLVHSLRFGGSVGFH